MLRVALVGGDDIGCDDAGCESLGQLCAALAACGHDTAAYVRRPGPGWSSADGYRVVPIAVGPRAAAPAHEVLPHVAEWATELERAWSSDPPDAVHAYGWLGGLAAQLAARRRRIPVVQSFLGLAATSRPPASRGRWQDSERGRIEWLLARSAAWVTGECAADVDALARMRRGRTRVSTLTGGVDVERYSPVGLAAPRTGLHRVLSLAPNLLWHNGIDISIEALAKVPGAELVIAETGRGDGPDDGRAALQRLAASLGVGDRVRFAGRVAGSELPALVRSGDVVACTPRRPPRATTVLRAMACGKAVVAPPVGVLGDVVIDNVTGLLLPTDSPGAFGLALRRVLAQSFQCEGMGAAGRSRAVSRFSWDRIALDSLDIYRQLGPKSPVAARPVSSGVRP